MPEHVLSSGTLTKLREGGTLYVRQFFAPRPDSTLPLIQAWCVDRDGAVYADVSPGTVLNVANAPGVRTALVTSDLRAYTVGREPRAPSDLRLPEGYVPPPGHRTPDLRGPADGHSAEVSTPDGPKPARPEFPPPGLLRRKARRSRLHGRELTLPPAGTFVTKKECAARAGLGASVLHNGTWDFSGVPDNGKRGRGKRVLSGEGLAAVFRAKGYAVTFEEPAAVADALDAAARKLQEQANEHRRKAEAA